MVLLGLPLAYAETERSLIVYAGMGDEQVAACIQPPHQGLIRLIASPMAEADQT